jgi:hypothetical protein
MLLLENSFLEDGAHHCGSSVDHVLSVVVAVGAEVHAASDPRERSLLTLRSVAKTTLLPRLLRAHLIGI